MTKSLDEIARALRPRTSVRGVPIERGVLEDQMKELKVPAVSLAVLDDGEVTARAWGASTETLFQAASISKPVAAMAAMNLAADGVIDIDRPVNDLLRDWTLPDGDGVTIRRILSHSAGLGVHGFPGYERGGELPSLVQILDGAPPANTAAVRVERPPGEAFQYSGGGYTLMQLVIEQITEKPFADVMRERVLDPLAMAMSTYEQPLPERLTAVAASAYGTDGSKIAGDWHVYPEQAAAGLWTTPSELLRVAVEMIEPRSVLTTAERGEMLHPQNDVYGLGWGLEPPWFHHGGSNEGFRCQLYGSVADRKACVVMTNSDAGGTICAEVLGAVAEVFGWPGFFREREAIDLDRAALDAIAGDYELAPEFTLSIRREGDALVSFGPGIPKRPTFAASATRLFRTDLDAEIEWTPGEITLVAGGSRFTASRRADP